MADLDEIEAQIQALTAQAKALRNAKRAGVISEMLTKISEHNIGVNELFPGGTAKKTKGTKSSAPAAVKYRGPKGEAWSGRGLTPRWMAVEIAAGKTKESFKV